MQRLTFNETASDSPVADNVARLKVLFPELVTEGPNGASVNVDVLKQLVGDQTVTDADEKYGLNWFGKRKARQLALTPSLGTLRPAPEESVDWEMTKNLMIEGDNLEVLKLLQKSYAGKVKLIYIDPPYNTGKDFVYPDDFRDGIRNYMEWTRQTEGGKPLSSNVESSGRFHTNWLNMMYPRIRSVHDLLTDDGIAFISLDNGEVSNFRSLCDDVFGEENLLEILVWRKRKTQANLSKHIAPVHEFILVYARNVNHVSINKLPYSKSFLESTFSNPDNDPRGPYQTRPLAQPASSKNPEFPIELPNGRKLTAKWSCSPETFSRYVSENRLYMPRDGEGMPRLKIFLSESEGILPNTWLDDIANMEEGSSKLNELFNGSSPFDFPKPATLIEHLLALGSLKESIVLDFFAGSGTTGHAVMAKNAADGGNRRYILVQLPEALAPENKDQKTAAEFCDKIGKPRNIAELTKERLRRAGAKIKSENPEWKGDTGFRVFKLDSSNIRAWDPNPEDIKQALLDNTEHLKPDRSESDLLYELLLKLGLDLSDPIEVRKGGELDARLREKDGLAVHAVGGGTLMACLAPRIVQDEVEPLSEGIIAWNKELSPSGETTCVFRDSAFGNDVAKTNLTAILEQNGIKNVRSL